MAKPKDNKGKKGAKEAAPKKTRKMYQLYEVQGDTLVRKNKFSPKSPGDFLANHKGRKTCGKTAYTEFDQKEVKAEEKSEEKKEE